MPQLLNYAKSAAELAGMWRNIATYLKPGGRFVGTMENHEVVLAPRLQSGRYGVRETEMNELPGGEGFQVHLRFDTQPVVEFDAVSNPWCSLLPLSARLSPAALCLWRADLRVL